MSVPHSKRVGSGVLPQTTTTTNTSATGPGTVGVDDLVLLSPLSESEIERVLRIRFERDLIYTNIGPVLLAVNPFRDIPGLYSDEMIELYRSGGSGSGVGGGGAADVSPLGSRSAAHIFALAEDTYRTMVAEEEDQCVIISGESGAGKTEASKQIMRYISSVSGDTPAMTHVKRIMLESNPLMEAFGNAKTLRNDNSSRFGKFLQIHFDRRGGPVGGKMSIFLLEKARVVYHQRGERNFHIFYQLCAGLGRGADGIVRRVPKTAASSRARDTNKARTRGAQGHGSDQDKEVDEDGGDDDEMDVVDHGALRERLRIGPASGFQYLRMGENLTRAGVDDAAEWLQTLQAMHIVGMPEPVVEQVITTLALVLHLGEIRFTGPGDAPADALDTDRARTGPERTTPPSSSTACHIVNGDSVAYCASLLGVAPDRLVRALTWRRLEVGQSEIVHVPLDLQQCHQARDAIAKALYDGVFNLIVSCVNTALRRVAADVEAEKEKGAKTRAGSGSPNDEDHDPLSPSRDDTPGDANQSSPPPLMLGVLDIYGFEIFDSNGFEQFCINYVNEKLQQIFIELTLCAEQEEYVREGIAWEPVQYFDNRVVVDLIESTTPPVGLFAVMDDVCAAMAKEDEAVVDVKMLDKLGSAASGHVRRVKTLYDERHPEEAERRAELWERQERERAMKSNGGGKTGDRGAVEEEPIQADFGAAHFLRTDRGFIIKHYAGDVRYNAQGFTARNKDRLNKDVTGVLASTDNAFLRNLFTEHSDVLSAEDVEAARGGSGTGKHAPTASTGTAPGTTVRRRATTAGSKIRAQAAELVQTLKRCNPHYVRTIKSNDKKQPRLFDDARVRHQVTYLGLIENVRVRRAGYSYRQYFDKFLKRFRYVCPLTYPRPYKGTDVEACHALLNYVSRHHSQGPTAFPAGSWQAGVHKLFIRQPAHLAALEVARTEAFDAIALKIQRAWRRYLNRRLYVQLKSRMSSLYALHGKSRRADSVFRAYQGTYECRWWPTAEMEDDALMDAAQAVGGVGGHKALAAAATRARRDHVERLLRPLIQFDPISSAWREVRTRPTATSTTAPSAASASLASRRGKVFYVNDLTGQTQWEPPREWRQGLQTIHFMSPVRRLTDHDRAVTTEEIVVLTDKALYVFREVLSLDDHHVRTDKGRVDQRDDRGARTGPRDEIPSSTTRVLHPDTLPPPAAYELRTKIDLRLLAGLSLSPYADEMVVVHVFPLPVPYRPLLFHRTETHTATSTSTASVPPSTPQTHDAKPPSRDRSALKRHPVCDACGARLSPSLFTVTDAPSSARSAETPVTLTFSLTAEARRRHACPCCGRWCCATRCLVHRRPLPTMTGSMRAVRVCPFCRTGEPLEPLQDLVLFTPIKTELVSLLCRTYQHVMANPLPVQIGGTLPSLSPASSSSSPRSPASMLLYQLADDKGGPRGVLVEPRTEATMTMRTSRTQASQTPLTSVVMETASTTTGERGQATLMLKDACYWSSPLASTLMAPAVPYRDALQALTRTTKVAPSTTTTTSMGSGEVSASHARSGAIAKTPVASDASTAVTEAERTILQPVSFITVLAAAGIAPSVVDKIEASREARRQAAAAQRRKEEEEQRLREEERDRERALAHRRLVQERKQARAAAELQEEEARLQHEAEAREREAKRVRLLKEKQKQL